MRATTEPLEGNKIRLSVEIEESEVDHAIDDMVRSLTRRARIPGFRPGKVPRRVLEARMGGVGAIREEAIREALPNFYAQAVTDVDADPIAPPEIEITAGEEQGPVAFEATIEIRPTVSVAGYEGLVVTVPSPAVTDQDIEQQIDRLRETDAELEPVQRPATDGDNVTIDIHGKDDTGEEVVASDDLLYELGSGTIVPELDQELQGKSVGDIFDFRATMPDGRRLSFRVLLKRVQRKVLPELTDEWVSENTESSTVDGLLEEMRNRLQELKTMQARMAQREGSLQALAALVDDEVVPSVLVDEELAERLQALERRLNAQNLSVQDFLQATGRDAEGFLADMRQEAMAGVKVDLALRALVEAESIEVSDEEFESELEESARRLDLAAPELRQRLDRAGRTAAVRFEQRKAKAMTWLIEHVDLVDEEGNSVPRETLEVEPQGVESGTTGPDGDEDLGTEDE